MFLLYVVGRSAPYFPVVVGLLIWRSPKQDSTPPVSKLVLIGRLPANNWKVGDEDATFASLFNYNRVYNLRGAPSGVCLSDNVPRT